MNGADRFTEPYVLDVKRQGDYTNRTSTGMAWQGKHYIGQITVRTESSFSSYGEAALALVYEANRREYGTANCQTWVEHMLRSYEDMGAIPRGSLRTVQANIPR